MVMISYRVVKREPKKPATIMSNPTKTFPSKPSIVDGFSSAFVVEAGAVVVTAVADP